MDDLTCGKCGKRLAPGRVRETCQVCGQTFCNECSKDGSVVSSDVFIRVTGFVCCECLEKMKYMH